MAETMTGRCLCGAVSYEANGVHTGYHGCHCGMCRRWGGGPGFAVSVDGVRFHGEDAISRYRSSEWAERGFCSRCGTNLFYRLLHNDDHVIWLGTFDDQAPFALQGEIYVDEKPAGYALAGDHPRMTGDEFLESIGMKPPSEAG